jgi:hypothetical protein
MQRVKIPDLQIIQHLDSAESHNHSTIEAKPEMHSLMYRN